MWICFENCFEKLEKGDFISLGSNLGTRYAIVDEYNGETSKFVIIPTDNKFEPINKLIKFDFANCENEKIINIRKEFFIKRRQVTYEK